MKYIFILGIAVIAFSCSSGKKHGTDLYSPYDISIFRPDTKKIKDIGHEDIGPVIGCQTKEDCPLTLHRCEPVTHKCVQCLEDKDCAEGFCVDNACKGKACKPDSRTCTKTGMARLCNADGTEFQEIDCLAKDMECKDGECVVCIPGEVACKNNAAMECKIDASGWMTRDCGELKCVQGQCMSCVPGFRKCEDEKVVQCNADGSAFEPFEDCKSEETGRICHLGQCIDLCKANEKFTTNLGCEYWPVDLEQYHGNGIEASAQDTQFSVVVGNTSKTLTATIKVFKEGQKVKEVQAPPQKATIINLDPYNVDGSMLGPRAWHIVSNLPVVAYQFNPLENVHVYSNDASMLMPANAAGRKYMVIGYPQRAGGQPQYVTIVGISKSDTTVKVTPTATIRAGTGMTEMPADQEYTFTLKQYDVLNLDTKSDFSDLTGTVIEADHAVTVYSGNVCENVPLEICESGHCKYEPSSPSCSSDSDCQIIGACDHMEQQLFPLKAVGKEYLVSKSWDRGKAPDLVRVLAVEDQTNIQISPHVTPIPTLNKGKHFDFEISESVLLSSDKPFMVAKFLEGEDAPGAGHDRCKSGLLGKHCGGLFGLFGKSCHDDSDCSDDANIGDPAFILAVPVEQYRKNYVFLVPTKYAENYVNIVTTQGANVTLDGAVVSNSGFQVVAGSNYVVARKPMSEGSHSIRSDQPMGIVVYGWDHYVSYGYPGGMNIAAIYSQ